MKRWTFWLALTLVLAYYGMLAWQLGHCQHVKGVAVRCALGFVCLNRNSVKP